jgi:hypothetical protein
MGTQEKKNTPELELLSEKLFPDIYEEKDTLNIQFYQPEEGITWTALERLYIDRRLAKQWMKSNLVPQSDSVISVQTLFQVYDSRGGKLSKREFMKVLRELITTSYSFEKEYDIVIKRTKFGYGVFNLMLKSNPQYIISDNDVIEIKKET